MWAGSLSSAWAADESRGGTAGVHQALIPHFPSPVPSLPPGATLLHVPLGATCYHSGLSSNATTSERASLTTSGQEPPCLVTHGSLFQAHTTVSKTLKRDSVDDLAVIVAFWWLSLKVSLSFRVTS